MKAKDIFLVVLGIYSLGLTITHCNRPKELITPSPDVAHRSEPPETVYRVLKIPSKLSTQVRPSTVILPPNLPIYFGTEVPTRDSVAAVELNQSNFKFTFQDSIGKVSQLDFKIFPDKYQYLWVDGQLTTQKLPLIKRIHFKPYISTGFRPIHTMLDVEGGLKIQYEKFNYTLGIQGYYYPNLQKDPGWDLRIGIQYEF